MAATTRTEDGRTPMAAVVPGAEPCEALPVVGLRRPRSRPRVEDTVAALKRSQTLSGRLTWAARSWLSRLFGGPRR